MFISKNTMSFPENFREISREIFREFSKFGNFPQNFPEIFIDSPWFYTYKKINFRSVKVYLHEKSFGIFKNFSGSSPEFSGEFTTLPKLLTIENFVKNFSTKLYTYYYMHLCFAVYAISVPARFMYNTIQ